jgi:hypothetical protein
MDHSLQLVVVVVAVVEVSVAAVSEQPVAYNCLAKEYFTFKISGN